MFRVIFFDIMPTSLIPLLAFLGKAIRRNIVHSKDLEHLSILRHMGIRFHVVIPLAERFGYRLSVRGCAWGKNRGSVLRWVSGPIMPLAQWSWTLASTCGHAVWRTVWAQVPCPLPGPDAATSGCPVPGHVAAARGAARPMGPPSGLVRHARGGR